MATYSSDYLRRLRSAVLDFEASFEAWMDTQVGLDHMESRGLLPTVSVNDEADPGEVRRLELELAEAAGLASRAVAVTGAYTAVQGAGVVDPIANWSTMSNPRALFSPRDLRITIAAVKGRLAALLADAEGADTTDLPAFSPAQLHPVIWTAAAPHWSVHKRRVAVREAAEALTQHWRDVLDRHDVDGTEFWQQTLSLGEPTMGRPRLSWPGPPTAKTTGSMRHGLELVASALTNLAAGLNLTVRNVATHTGDELSEQEAMERLSAYSYLARQLDRCEVHRIDRD